MSHPHLGMRSMIINNYNIELHVSTPRIWRGWMPQRRMDRGPWKTFECLVWFRGVRLLQGDWLGSGIPSHDKIQRPEAVTCLGNCNFQ